MDTFNFLPVSKEDMQSVRWEASVDLYNALVKNVAYLRQNEIMDGISNPTRQEKELNAIIMDARDCDKAVINIPRTCFLGEFIHEFNVCIFTIIISFTMPPSDS